VIGNDPDDRPGKRLIALSLSSYLDVRDDDECDHGDDDSGVENHDAPFGSIIRLLGSVTRQFQSPSVGG
jgi:hypothetical protein